MVRQAHHPEPVEGAPPYQKLNWRYLGRRTSVYAAPVSFYPACIQYRVDIRTLTGFSTLCENGYWIPAFAGMTRHTAGTHGRQRLPASRPKLRERPTMTNNSPTNVNRTLGAAQGHFLFAMSGSLLIIGRSPASSGLILSVEGLKSRILTKSFR